MTDTRGRTRAAKRRAELVIRESLREDEVDFHPRYLSGMTNVEHSVVEQDTSSVMESMEDATPEGGVSSSTRVDILENEMAHVKAKVNSMDAKLDLLITATTGPARTSTPTPAPAAHGGPRRRDVHIPPPRRLRQEFNQSGYVDQMLREERFKPGTTDGKVHLASDVFTDFLLPKPYMYVTREGCHTLKQKLDLRSNLSPMEYVHASIKLVNDPRAYDQEDREHIMRHIQHVTHDIMERPWEGVRRWSQFIWDAVEKGQLKWSDTQLIENHRFCIAMTGGGRATQAAGGEVKGAKSEVICRAFNSRAGCRSRTHHDEGQVKHLHICSFCDSLGRHCTGHNVLGCNNKTLYPGQPRHAPPPQYQQNMGMRQQQDSQTWRPNPPPMYHQQYPAQSKNGQ